MALRLENKQSTSQDQSAAEPTGRIRGSEEVCRRRCRAEGDSSVATHRERERGYYVREGAYCVREGAYCVREGGYYVREGAYYVRERGYYVREG
eukprot:2533547-Pyramimonas_sp.AAC.1